MKRQPWQTRGRGVSTVLVALAATSFIGGASAPKPHRSHAADSSRWGRPECSGEGVRITIRDSVGKTPTGSPVTYSHVVTDIPLSGRIADIPEFHDCQEFVVRRAWYLFWRPAWEYDHLYSIFASFGLDSLWRDLHSGDTLTLPSGATVRTVPVATIYSDGGTYPQLGIRPGFNCLLLYRQPPNNAPPDTGWGAKMIPLGTADSSCLAGDVDENDPGTLLQVRASSLSSLTAADYPAAARWDWDPVHSEQYIGIKCVAAWCQVGRTGFDTSASYTGPPLPFKPIGTVGFTPAELTRVTAIKGWYDEQRLAASGTAGLQPSAMRGMLFPNPDIHGLKKIPDMYNSKWVQVGFAVVFGGDYHKWNMRQRVNEILLCHGSVLACAVPTNQPPEPPTTMLLTSCATGWWAKVVPYLTAATTGQPRYFCLKLADHTADLAALNAAYNNLFISSIPGTARWRWLLKDEGTWHGCLGSSCCSGGG